MARVSNVVQDLVLVEDVAKLENSFISDVIAILRQNSDESTAEQERDLSDFENGRLGVEVLYLKYWQEDGSWKNQLADLTGVFRSFNLDIKDAAVCEGNDTQCAFTEGTDGNEDGNDDGGSSSTDSDTEGLDTSMKMAVDEAEDSMDIN